MEGKLSGLVDRNFEEAVGFLNSLMPKDEETQQSRFAGLVQQVLTLDQPKVIYVARVVENGTKFSRFILEHVKEMRVKDRYEQIGGVIDSIVEDSKMAIGQLEDGEIDWKEKASRIWMQLRRGSVATRVQQVERLHEAVSDDVKKQLDYEADIIQAYVDYRNGAKRGEAIAYELLGMQQKRLDEARQTAATAAKAVDDFRAGREPATLAAEERGRIAELELERNRQNQALDAETKGYHLVKDIAEHMTLDNNLADTLIARLRQSNEVKDAVYRRNVILFSTTQTSFAALGALYTSIQGTHEAAEAGKAYATGVTKAVEAVAQQSDTVLRQGLEAAFGKTIDAKAIAAAVDAVVKFKEESIGLIQKFAEEQTENVREAERVVADGQKRYEEAHQRYLQGALASA